jgi:hypothetical protein
MRIRLQLLTLAAGVLLWGFAATEAKAGLVDADAGTFTFSLHSDGAGHATLSFSNVLLTTIRDNGVVTTGLSIGGTMSTLAINYLQLTGPPPTGSYTFGFVSTGLKDFGAAGADVSMSYDTVLAGTNTIGSLGIVGTMPTTNPIVNLLPGHDFSPFANGGQIALSLSDVGVDIGKIIAGGGNATGTGGFTEIANVPEPASLALLGIGMSGFLAFRRYFRKPSVA